jgi:hypothetical protein
VGDEAEVAEAAVAAGLDFVVITDHRAADAPPNAWKRPARYLDGVLLVRGQELPVAGAGRLLVFGLDTVLTRWQDGPDALAPILQRAEAFAAVAHPRSPRTRDNWRPAETPGIAGWAVFDVADAARARLAGPWALYHLLALTAGFPLGRGHEGLLRLFREGFDGPAVAAYDSLYALGPLTALGGLDVHPKARLAGRILPGYRPFFKSVVNHVGLEAPLPVDAAEAARALARGLAAGHVFVSFGETAKARRFVITAGRQGALAPWQGGTLPWEPGLVLRAGFVGGPEARPVYRVVRDGRTVAWVRAEELAWPVPGPGVYRVEVYRYTARLGSLFWDLRPWIFSNPIRVAPPQG